MPSDKSGTTQKSLWKQKVNAKEVIKQGDEYTSAVKVMTALAKK